MALIRVTCAPLRRLCIRDTRPSLRAACYPSEYHFLPSLYSHYENGNNFSVGFETQN